MRSGVFSTRWTGQVTPDGDVEGALFNVLGRWNQEQTKDDCDGTGARLFIEGELVANMWCKGDLPASGNFTSVSSPIDLKSSEPLNIVVEYWQDGGARSPVMALQWSLLSTVTDNDDSVDSIAAAAKVASESCASIVVLGGANNDGDQTTEGEGE